MKGSAVLLRMIAFATILLVGFTVLSYLLPQFEGHPPAEIIIESGPVDSADFIDLGELVYTTKGACPLCHNDLGRAPKLLGGELREVVRARLADSRYRGKTKTFAGYLRESMTDPGIFVVSGFGVAGSQDEQSPMPPMDKPPISLSEREIEAVIAYLEAENGSSRSDQGAGQKGSQDGR